MYKVNNKNIHSSSKAYFCYLFQIFFRRPFGYIIPIIYFLYLAVILVIVPHAINRNPLFIWTLAGIDMPAFNLFFIAGFSAVLAITIFRITREDGTELIISSKPITKSQCLFLKTLVYLIIMLFVCLLCFIITSLLLPVFGEYNEHTNITGITIQKYIAINLSVLVGNLLNMFLFGGLAILFSLIGGQIITMIGCIGIILFLSLVNFLSPRIFTTPIDVLTDNYGISIKSYSCNTLNQYESNFADKQINFASIECTTSNNGKEEQHYDTAKYWLLAQSSSNASKIHYFNIAKQLSSSFSSFGMNETQINEVAKLSIGTNNSYKYSILPSSNVSNKNNVNKRNYPITFYYQQTIRAQGMIYPKVIILGGFTGLAMDNWYIISYLNNFAFDAVSVLTKDNFWWTSSDKIMKNYSVNYFRMKDLIIEKEKWSLVEDFYNQVLNNWFSNNPKHDFSNTCLTVLSNSDNCKQATGVEYNELSPYEQYKYISQFHLAWAILAQQKQIKYISDFLKTCDDMTDDEKTYPFTTKAINKWHAHLKSLPADSKMNDENDLGINLFTNGIKVSNNNQIIAYDHLVYSSMDYAETYSNLYQYIVTDYYDISTIVSVWSAIAFIFFLTSVIIYRRIDFR